LVSRKVTTGRTT